MTERTETVSSPDGRYQVDEEEDAQTHTKEWSCRNHG